MPPSSNYRTLVGEKEIMRLYDNILARWPGPYETKTIATRHGSTFVIINGKKSAPPLILLHGAQANAVSWVGEIENYSRQFRVYAVDVIGEPGKSSQNRPSWEGNAYAEWMEDVVDGLGIQKVSILGISQGGWIAIKYAARQPVRVDKLVLLAPAGIVPTKASFILRAVAFSVLGRWGAERLNRYVFGRQPIDPVAWEFLNAIMVHYKARIEKEHIFSDEELSGLTMPVLLIGGSEDVVRSIDSIASRMKEHVGGLTTVTIPNAGHVLMNRSSRIIPFLMGE